MLTIQHWMIGKKSGQVKLNWTQVYQGSKSVNSSVHVEKWAQFYSHFHESGTEWLDLFTIRLPMYLEGENKLTINYSLFL
jgi:hypothetical protein